MARHPVVHALLAWLLLTQAFRSDALKQSKASSGDEIVDTKYGLNLSVKLDREKYRLVENPKITTYLKNVGTSPITLYRKMAWGASSSFLLGVADANGIWLNPTVLSDYRDRPPFAREDFITLQSAQSLELKNIIGLDSEGVTQPGKYTVTLWYHSPVSLDFAPKGMNVFVKENGSLQSKPVAFEVTP